LPPELQREVVAVVADTRQRSRWPTRRILRRLEVSPASYYRWVPAYREPASSPATRASPASLYEILPAERQAILGYAAAHPQVRHRELAWKMVDDGVVAVSPSTVYRVLGEANLVCRWRPKSRRTNTARRAAPARPDEWWQTDIRYVKLCGRNYYLLAFLDVYSRYVVYHELLRWMDGRSVAIAAAAAIGTLALEAARPTIQSDHGSCFIAREFAETLTALGAGHHLIRPHTPTDNAEIERCNRTLGERIDELLQDDADFLAAAAIIDGVVGDYNHHRLHSSLNFLRPVDYYRGNPETLLAERRRKLTTARELRKQENTKLRQRQLPFAAGETVSYSERRVVSL
jgi:transposase InsO family protein